MKESSQIIFLNLKIYEMPNDKKQENFSHQKVNQKNFEDLRSAIMKKTDKTKKNETEDNDKNI
jgi:hypothetical protein